MRASNIDDRRVQRRKTGIRAGLRKPGSRRFDVEVVDLSTHGFRAETAAHLQPGATVWLTLPGLTALEAVVRWRDAWRCGCGFRLPLHQAVFERVVANGA